MTVMSEQLTPATVRWAYRFLLGRDPESEDVVTNWAGAGSLSGLREGILVSPEMAGLALSGFPEQGTWIDNQATDEAAAAVLTLRDSTPANAAAVQELRLRCPSLRSLRRHLLSSPGIEGRLPQPEGPRSRKLRLLDAEFILEGDSREPEFVAAPGLAPRYASLLNAAWADGGEGRVIVDSGAGIGVTTLGLAAGAPDHAALIAFEPSLRKAAALAGNLAGNGFARAASRAVAMDAPAAMMRAEGLTRLDLLRLNAPGAARLAAELAPWLLEQGTMTLVAFDLAELLTETGPGPRDVLAACCAAFPHVVAFNAAHEPQPLVDAIEMNAAIHRCLMRPDRRDEFLLCADLDWLDRFETL